MQLGDYFVVGGPVQPDRACYIERAADAALMRGVEERRFCYVLAARSTGKSSLMARCIRDLRGDGRLAAVVDLSQIAAHSEAGAAARWYYAIAYRVLRELRLKFDLQRWWQERSALGEQRLAEFFIEVILTHTSVPVTVFIDEIERTLSLPFARDLFATIHTCYARRVSDPELERLNFVVLGVASPATLCTDPSLSPFLDGVAIEPADFTLEQCQTLAPGFEDEAAAPALLARIHEWSGGQPYLTQRMARAVVRRSGRAEDVERIVRERFLAPGAAEKDPYLNRIRLQLTRRGALQRQALGVLGKLARGVRIAESPRSASQEFLRLAGVTAADAGGQVRYRNRIVRDVFGTQWLAGVRPFDWRRALGVAALAAAAVLVPAWYSQILPQPYLGALSNAATDLAAAEAAHEQLRRLPGFAGTADRLLTEAMTGRSRAATALDDMRAADRVLRERLEQPALADQLAAHYWLRRASDAMRAERRDEAVLLALEALPASGTEARSILAELIGSDFARRRDTVRLAAAPAGWSIDWQAGALAVVDAAAHARRIVPAGLASDRAAAHAHASVPVRLTALQRVPVQRELAVDEPGLAGAFRLDVRIRHPRPDDLEVMLTAPGDASARLVLEHGAGPAQPSHSFRAVAGSPLAVLGRADRRGVWRLTVVDGRPGAAGELIDWSLSFADTPWAWRDAPSSPLRIPEPVRTAQVDVVLSPDGRYAAASATRHPSAGAVALWDLRDGRLLHDLEIAARPHFVAFGGGGSRLLIGAGDEFAVWDGASGRRLGRLDARHGAAMRPAVSVDGEFVAHATRRADGEVRMDLVRIADAAVVARTVAPAGARSWVLGPAARYAALVESDGQTVRIVDPRRASAPRQLRHEREVQALVAAPAGDALLTVDDLGEIRVFRVPLDLARPGAAEWRSLGTTIDADSVSVSSDGRLAAFAAPHGEVIVRDLLDAQAIVRLRVGDRHTRTRFGPDGRTLATLQGGILALWDLDADDVLPGGEPTLTALAIDPGGTVAALGFRAGHVRVRSASELTRAAKSRGDAIDYIGHRGPVTSVAISAQHALIASGGGNGLVRVWDLASVAPTKHFMRHPPGPIEAVAISPNGRWVASAADRAARLWRVADGALQSEVRVNGTALAVAFAPSSARWAIGDSAGNVIVAEHEDGEIAGSVRAQGAVRSLAFGRDGSLLASGDDTGHLELWNTAELATSGARLRFEHPIHWLGFTSDGAALVVQTEHWLHRVVIDDGSLRILGSRLAPIGAAAGGALASSDGSVVRLVTGQGSEPLAFHEIALDLESIEPLPASSPLLARDWRRALALDVSADGEVVPRMY